MPVLNEWDIHVILSNSKLILYDNIICSSCIIVQSCKLDKRSIILFSNTVEFIHELFDWYILILYSKHNN